MNVIATSSIEDALDFGLNLICKAVADAGQGNAGLAQKLLSYVSNYISLRYAGELRLAFECLEDIAEIVPRDVEFRREQFRRQLDWIRERA